MIRPMRTGQIASMLAVLGVAACVDTTTNRCDDGTSCPADMSCRLLTEPEPDLRLCVTANQLEACGDAPDQTECVLGEGTGSLPGTCFSGACVPAVCGDNIVDATEACDVGDRVAGDGCSANCLSREVCGDGLVDLALGEQCDDGQIGQSGDRCSSTCLQEYELWSDRSPRAPGFRTEHAVARAPEGGVMMFGGIPGQLTNPNAMTRLGEGWRWDGSSWSELVSVTPPPAPRASAAAAYHPGKRVTLLFGGRDSNDGALDDLWQWDGVGWTAITATGSRPSARWDASLACSPTRCVLFGGRNSAGVSSGETWIWNGTSWSELMGPGPSPRSRAAVAYDSVRDLFILFGGHNTGVGFEDTWNLGTGWTASTSLLNPPADSAPSATFNTLAGEVVLVAGGETWTQTSDTWNNISRPYVAKAPSIVFDPDTNRVTLMSEARTPSTLEPGGWSLPLDNRRPEAAPLGLVSAYSPKRGRTLVVELGNTWEWDGRSWHRIPLTASQPAPRNAALVFDTACDVAVLFGGSGGSGDQTWSYNGAWTQHTIPGPTARTLHAMTYDAKRNVVVVFGGLTGSTLLGDVWELGGPCNARTWTQVPTTAGPTPRKNSRLAFDHARGVAVLFGGEDATERADTWEWDGTTWMNRSPAGSPPPRTEHAMVYDLRRRAVVLFGGIADTEVLGDTWTWNGIQWTKLAPITSAPGRRGMTMALDRTGAVVMFGGETSEPGLVSDVWRLAAETNLEPVERCAISNVDEDGDGLTTCDDPDCAWRCEPLCAFGGSCTSPRCGDGTCGPVEDHVMCPADCMTP